MSTSEKQLYCGTKHDIGEKGNQQSQQSQQSQPLPTRACRS